MPEITNKDILEAISGLTNKVEGIAGKVDSNAEAIQALAQHMDEQHAQTRSELRSEIYEGSSSLKKELTDFRYATEEGFNSVEHMIREEDKKIDRVTEKLLLKKVVTEKDAKEILALGAFPLQSSTENSAA